jgi:hypothetical protein
MSVKARGRNALTGVAVSADGALAALVMRVAGADVDRHWLDETNHRGSLRL